MKNTGTINVTSISITVNGPTVTGGSSAAGLTPGATYTASDLAMSDVSYGQLYVVQATGATINGTLFEASYPVVAG